MVLTSVDVDCFIQWCFESSRKQVNLVAAAWSLLCWYEQDFPIKKLLNHVGVPVMAHPKLPSWKGVIWGNLSIGDNPLTIFSKKTYIYFLVIFPSIYYSWFPGWYSLYELNQVLSFMVYKCGTRVVLIREINSFPCVSGSMEWCMDVLLTAVYPSYCAHVQTSLVLVQPRKYKIA